MSLQIKAARKFLELVSHLHHRGHQLLRIVPYVRDGPAPIWACDLVPASATRKDHGALTPDFEFGPGFFSVRYVPNSPWPGFVDQSLDEAASYFIQHHFELAEETLGRDDAYVRWYEEMLVATAPKAFVASILYWKEPSDYMYVLNNVNENKVFVPLPPPGNA